jgi:cytochrome c-type biogenesis protein CcmH
MRAFLLILLMALIPLPALSVEPDEMLDDPALEARARDISKELRCLVCQNESIDESDAQLARDLRLLVRERLETGNSDKEVIDYVVSRYGDFVLLRPPFKATTYVLWIGPAAIAGIGLLALIFYFRRRAAAAGSTSPAPLTEEERRRVESLLEGGGK